MVIDGVGGILGGLIAGALLGLLFFRLLALNTSLYAAGRAGTAAAVHVGRLALVITLLVLAARQGAGPLLALLGGFLAVRPFLMRRYGRA